MTRRGAQRLIALDASLEAFGGDRSQARLVLAAFLHLATPQPTSMTMDREAVVPTAQDLEPIDRRVQGLAGRRTFCRPTQIMLDPADPQPGDLFTAWAYWCPSAHLVGPRCDFELIDGGDHAEFRLDRGLHRRLLILLAERGLGPGQCGSW